MIDDPENFGGYFPFECLGRMEHLGIFCVTVDRAAYIISKYGYVEDYEYFEMSDNASYDQWSEILTKAIERSTLKTVLRKLDLGDKINIYQTALDLHDLETWLEDRDVSFPNDELNEIIQNRITLLHKADTFIKTESMLGENVQHLDRVDLLADRLEAALSENRRLQSLLSESVNGDTKPIDKVINKKSESLTINIIGALCDLYWKAKNPDKPKLIKDEIYADLASYSSFAGLSERNLKDKIPKGIKAIRFE